MDEMDYTYDVHETPWTPPEDYRGYITWIDNIRWKDDSEELPESVAIEGEVYDGESVYEILEAAYEAELESYGKPSYECY